MSKMMAVKRSSETLPLTADIISAVDMTRNVTKDSVESFPTHLEKKSTSADITGLSTASEYAPSIVNEVLGSRGQKIPNQTRQSLGSRYSFPLDRIRMHRGVKAASSVRAVNALAYTVGNHIVLGDRVNPLTPGGQRLVAHELTHVLQQSKAKIAHTLESTSPRIPVVPKHHASESEARLTEQCGNRKGSTKFPLPDISLQRAGFWENVKRFFGGGKFSKDELMEYLNFLDINDRIEDNFDSDNKAREIVSRWADGDSSYFLTIRRKILLINEMLSGFTGDSDENAILTILKQSNDTEVGIIVRDVTISSLNNAFQGLQQKQLDNFLAAWRERTENPSSKTVSDDGTGETAGTNETAAVAPAEDYIQRIIVDQNITQHVDVHWKSGRFDTDICSTGKGQCCVDPTTPNAVACSESDSRRSGTNCTPVGEHTVARKIPVTGGGVKLWTEFQDGRDIALHKYFPVDGTPLSHGCVRLNQPMAQLIYDGSVDTASNRDRSKRPTKVEVKNLARPRCDYPMLQREWANDFNVAVTVPADGETLSTRTRNNMRRTRARLRRGLGDTDEQLDERIHNLKRETGGLNTDVWNPPEERANKLSALAPIAPVIPRCAVTEQE